MENNELHGHDALYERALNLKRNLSEIGKNDTKYTIPWIVHFIKEWEAVTKLVRSKGGNKHENYSRRRRRNR